MSVTPESDKTVSITSQQNLGGPTPKNEFKVPMNQRSYFSSPTDALVSPCTQKLMKSRLLPNRSEFSGNPRPRHIQTTSLADKENKHTAPSLARVKQGASVKRSTETDV